MADILNKLNSANYITVKVTDDPITNGNNLLAAYSLAKSTNPNGIAKSATNRLDIILPVAIYDLGTQSLTLDTQYIDLIGSTNDRNNHYIKSNISAVSNGTVAQTANDVKLINLTIENTNTTYTPALGAVDETRPSAYFPNNNLNLVYIENVRFLGNDSNVYGMRSSINYMGIYINCTAGNRSFGYQGSTTSNSIITLGGTFTNCSAGDNSFGSSDYSFGMIILSGTFTNCSAGNNSFGYMSSIPSGIYISGTFTNCSAGNNSFGYSIYGANLSGIFKNCSAGDNSLGAASGLVLSTITGIFINCTAGSNSFSI